MYSPLRLIQILKDPPSFVFYLWYNPPHSLMTETKIVNILIFEGDTTQNIPEDWEIFTWSYPMYTIAASPTAWEQATLIAESLVPDAYSGNIPEHHLFLALLMLINHPQLT